MNGAFNGFGIPQDLKTEDSTIKNDPYLLKLREILSQENIMNNQKQDIPKFIDKQTTPERSPTLDPKPILKQTFSNGEYNNKYGYHDAIERI